MRHSVCLFVSFFIGVLVSAQNIIPQPIEIKRETGQFVLGPSTVLLVKNGVDNASADFLNDYLKRYAGFSLKKTKTRNYTNTIEISTLQTLVAGKEGAYSLSVGPKGISIAGETASGTFYGIQTLIQLLPLQKSGTRFTIPSVHITDAPRFAYRGMHLDVSRHFFPVSFIKKYIDYLALHKFNTFHWHLTEDQGWRIEIKRYPKLTSTGGWRNGTIIGRYPGTGSDNKRYGGYYTQAEIKEVVSYANARFIDVIPEIEMPGHGSAAIAAYSWLSCFPQQPTAIPPHMISKKSVEEQDKGRIKLVQETWGVFDDVFCAGNDSTFTFLQNVIDEVITLFPSKYFHIGGDECPKTHWKKCPRCQQRMKDNNLKDEHELQSYFVQRIEKYLNSKGKTLIGWDEILEGGLAPKAVVMSWRGEEGGIAAAKQKHNVIMTPGNPVYFDHTQSLNEDSVTIGGYNPIEKVYAYEPIPQELSVDEGKYVLGAQANVWTEYMKNTRKVEYMVFPRMAALSEVLWSKKENRNWEKFEKRLQHQFTRYERWKVNHSRAYFDLKATVIPANDNSGVIWKIQSKYSRDICEYCHIQITEDFVYENDTEIVDTVPRYDPNDINKIIGYDTKKTIKKAGEKGSRYGNRPWMDDTLAMVKVSESKIVKAYQRFHHSKGPDIEQQFYFNKTTGKKVVLKTEPSRNYPGDGAFTLVNGVQNTKGLARSREFLGWTGDDLEAIIDLGKDETISNAVIHSLSSGGSWIYPPKNAEILVSVDGQNFSSAGRAENFETTTGSNGVIRITFSPVSARYIKVVVKNLGAIPDGKPGAGNKAWLFVDEIEVN